MSLWVALVAMGIDATLGYSQRLVERIGHPVIWIGALIAALETRLNAPGISFALRRLLGALTLGVVLLVVFGISFGIMLALRALPFGWVAEAVLASSLLAQKGLRDAVLRVSRALDARNIPAARVAVSHIVGRDTAGLDEAEIARAAVETLAENASDGIVAPLFYLALFGLPGAALYKAINTADSMIGHRSERYAAFGWAAARLDDLVNFLPARLTAVAFIVAAAKRGASASGALNAVKRDARRHASPNAGWPEAAMAGALGLGLGGPRAYAGAMLDLPHMGDGRRELDARDIGAAIELYERMLWLSRAVLACAAVIWVVV